jgi:hypothetical protein
LRSQRSANTPPIEPNSSIGSVSAMNIAPVASADPV